MIRPLNRELERFFAKKRQLFAGARSGSAMGDWQMGSVGRFKSASFEPQDSLMNPCWCQRIQLP
jgi:hypothetical protein